MKETLKDKYIKVLNNTPSVYCSKCGSTDLSYDKYGVSLVDGGDVFKDYTCNDCNYEGVEWYT